MCLEHYCKLCYENGVLILILLISHEHILASARRWIITTIVQNCFISLSLAYHSSYVSIASTISLDIPSLQDHGLGSSMLGYASLVLHKAEFKLFSTKVSRISNISTCLLICEFNIQIEKPLHCSPITGLLDRDVRVQCLTWRSTTQLSYANAELCSKLY